MNNDASAPPPPANWPKKAGSKLGETIRGTSDQTQGSRIQEFDGPNTRPTPDLSPRLDDFHHHLRELDTRLGQVEGNITAIFESLRVDAARRERLDADYRQVKRVLKITISAIERLAKGKSLGALGLPSQEDWDSNIS